MVVDVMVSHRCVAIVGSTVLVVVARLLATSRVAIMAVVGAKNAVPGLQAAVPVVPVAQLCKTQE